jgi:hypothetical protein
MKEKKKNESNWGGEIGWKNGGLTDYNSLWAMRLG